MGFHPMAVDLNANHVADLDVDILSASNERRKRCRENIRETI